MNSSRFFVDWIDARFPTSLMFCIFAFVLFIVLARAVLLMPGGTLRKITFACLNILFLIGITLSEQRPLIAVPTYILIVIVLYLLTRSLAFHNKWWIAVIAPISLLVINRCGPHLLFDQTLGWVGISYMVFRLAQLVVIVRNEVTPMPDVFEYLGFAFFFPTMLVGPISSYSTFYTSIKAPSREVTPLGRSVLRVLVGGVKFLLFASVLNQFDYSALLFDGHPHPAIILPISALAYLFFFYLNFSGFCDIAIGSSGIIGIKVSENFNSPFHARNIQDFWNRWHITLSSLMRDMFFIPLSKALSRRLPKSMNHLGVAFSIAVTFILIGIWHGNQMRYLAFGIIHAGGVICNYYYGIFLKRHLSLAQLQWYRTSPVVHAACVTLTFVFVTASYFVFWANYGDYQELGRILY